MLLVGRDEDACRRVLITLRCQRRGQCRRYDAAVHFHRRVRVFCSVPRREEGQAQKPRRASSARFTFRAYVIPIHSAKYGVEWQFFSVCAWAARSRQRENCRSQQTSNAWRTFAGCPRFNSNGSVTTSLVIGSPNGHIDDTALCQAPFQS